MPFFFGGDKNQQEYGSFSSTSTSSSFDHQAGRLTMEFSDMQKESDTDRVVEKRIFIECVGDSLDPSVGGKDLAETTPEDVRNQMEHIKKTYKCDITTKTYANDLKDYMRNRHLYAEGEPEKETGVPFEEVAERYNIRMPSRSSSLDSLFVSPFGTEHLRELQESFERTARTLGRMLEDTWRLMDSYSLRDLEPIRKEKRDDQE